VGEWVLSLWRWMGDWGLCVVCEKGGLFAKLLHLLGM
jgi:hypothetical protein